MDIFEWVHYHQHHQYHLPLIAHEVNDRQTYLPPKVLSLSSSFFALPSQSIHRCPHSCLCTFRLFIPTPFSIVHAPAPFVFPHLGPNLDKTEAYLLSNAPSLMMTRRILEQSPELVERILMVDRVQKAQVKALALGTVTNTYDTSATNTTRNKR